MERGRRETGIEPWFTHFQHNHPDRGYLNENDIALVKLKERVPLKWHTRSACLPAQGANVPQNAIRYIAGE